MRSVTETSMMFMMPTPPTTSEIMATTNSKVLINWVVDDIIFDHFGHVADAEIVLAAGRMRCRSRSSSVICVDRRLHLGFRGRLDHDLIDVGKTDRLRRVGGLDGRTRWSTATLRSG